MKITGYHIFIGLMILFFLFGLFSPQENSYIGMEGNDNFTDNFTNMSQPADQSPLMSTPDNVVSDEEGWWKHDGHSTVTGGNVSTSSSGDKSSENPEKNNNEGEDSEEIPEFPGLAIPFIAVMGIAMFFNRK
jgi:hypothetical protein